MNYLRKRASPSGLQLSVSDAAIAKAMLERGDRQHDIAAWFGVNGGRIAEIASRKTHVEVLPAVDNLPPPGPYPAGRDSMVALTALAEARSAIEKAYDLLNRYSRE